MSFFILIKSIGLLWCAFVYGVCVCTCVCAPWCLYRELCGVSSLFPACNRACLQMFFPQSLLLSLSFKKKGPTDHPEEHLESLVQLQTSVQPPWRGPPQHCTHTPQHIPRHAVLKPVQATHARAPPHPCLIKEYCSEPGPASGPCTHTKPSCVVFLSCFVSLLVWPHGAWAE